MYILPIFEKGDRLHLQIETNWDLECGNVCNPLLYLHFLPLNVVEPIKVMLFIFIVF